MKCDQPPIPDPSYLLEAIKEDDEPTAFDDQVYFRCREGRKFESDLFKTNQSAVCRQGNTWDPPVEGWMRCVDSKYRGITKSIFKTLRS